MVPRRYWLVMGLWLLLGSCSFLHQAQLTNQRRYAQEELDRIIATLQAKEFNYQVPRTLYLSDDDGEHTEELGRLLNITSSQYTLATQIALLQGDGEALLRFTRDTVLLANAHLLMGNVAEAERLMHLFSGEDAPTEALIFIHNNRLEEAEQCLQATFTIHSDASVRLRAARLLTLISSKGYEYLRDHSMSAWERFMASTRLGNRAYNTPVEGAYVAFVEAMAGEDSLAAKRAGRELLALSPSPWRDHALRELFPLLTRYQYWLEVYQIATALPIWDSSDLYLLNISAFEGDIDVLRRYEAPESVSSLRDIKSAPREGSFRSLWGNVSNVDNWAMEQVNYFAKSSMVSLRPSSEEYQAARARITLFFDTLGPTSGSPTPPSPWRVP